VRFLERWKGISESNVAAKVISQKEQIRVRGTVKSHVLEGDMIQNLYIFVNFMSID
jgi:hypothetical protein